MVHHSHSPAVIELKVEQFAHLHDVALSGRSYGCIETRDEKKNDEPLGLGNGSRSKTDIEER